jgi:hypothetical protein
MSLAGVKKKCKKCYQIWFWRLLAFVTDFGIFLAINRMCSAGQFVFKTTRRSKNAKNVTRFGFWQLLAFVTDFAVVLAINLVTFFAFLLNPCHASDILRSKMSRSKLKTCHFEH